MTTRLHYQAAYTKSMLQPFHIGHVKPTSSSAGVLSMCPPPAAAAALPCPALPCPALPRPAPPCPAAALSCCLPTVHLPCVNLLRALSPSHSSSSCLTGHQPGALRTRRIFARDPQAQFSNPKRTLSLIPRGSWASARPLDSPSATR